MKVIFLDIDGILNVYPQGRDKYGALFHPEFENNLKNIVEQTGAKIVISSTWRMAGLEVMKQMWKDRNLAGEVIDITPRMFIYNEFDEYQGQEKRGTEIERWIKDNPKVIKYIIIDDDTDMLPHQMNNFIQTSTNIHHPDCVDLGYGLTKICTEKAIRILNS